MVANFNQMNSMRSNVSESQTPSFMRLVRDESEPTGAERRIFPRKEVHDHVQGRRLDHDISARREPCLNLSMRDLSMGGLSAISQTPINKGERVSVYFPPQGVHRGWDALGRVLRCQPSGFGYRVAVEFDPMPMAA